jgi:hypothetical protein
MAGNLPDTQETALLNYYLRTTDSATFTQAPSLWVGLCTATPTDAATNECTVTNNYGRVQIAWSPANAGSAVGPTGTATFVSASGTWGAAINGYIICAASTGSTGSSQYLAYGTVSPSVAVTTNDTVSFAAAAMTLSFD